MPNMYDLAISVLNQNPNIANTPMGQNFMEALRNRDDKKGQELANNILQSRGIDRETAMNEIRSKLPNIPFLR